MGKVIDNIINDCHNNFMTELQEKIIADSIIEGLSQILDEKPLNIEEAEKQSPEEVKKFRELVSKSIRKVIPPSFVVDN